MADEERLDFPVGVAASAEQSDRGGIEFDFRIQYAGIQQRRKLLLHKK